MKKIKLLIILLVVLLVFSGTAYAVWMEQINISVSAKTAYTDLEIDEYSSSGAKVSTSPDSTATIDVSDIEPSKQATAEIVYKNTGSIPISIDSIEILNISGYSKEHEKNLRISVQVYVDGKKVYNKTRHLKSWDRNSSITKGDQLAEIPVGETFKVFVRVKFDNSNKKKEEIFEDVQFEFRPDYSRFNKD